MKHKTLQTISCDSPNKVNLKHEAATRYIAFPGWQWRKSNGIMYHEPAPGLINKIFRKIHEQKYKTNKYTLPTMR